MADASLLHRNRSNNNNSNSTQGRISFFGRAGRNRQTQLMLLTMFGILALLGLLFVARHRTTATGAYDTASIPVFNNNTESNVSLTANEKEGVMSGPYKAFLANVNYKSARKLTSDQLEDLVGMYYAKEPKVPELEALFNKNERIIVREQLPEKTRVIPPNTMVTMDFVEDRLNVHLDDTSHIKKVKYG